VKYLYYFIPSNNPSGYTQQGGPASAAIAGQTGKMLQMQLLETNNNINAIKEGAEQPFFLASDFLNNYTTASGSVSSGDGPKKPAPSQPKGPVSSGSKANSFQFRAVSSTYYQLDFGAQGGTRGGSINLGTGISAFDLAVGVYSEYGHNHKTYKTTKGIEKPIYNLNGGVRSARAAQFARASNFVRGVAVVGSLVSTTYSGYKVYDQIQTGGLQNVNGWDATDTGVGMLGLGATGAVYFGLMSNPIGWTIGTGVLIYSGSRLAYDLYNEP